MTHEVTNKQIAEVFRAARVQLANGNGQFICRAIEDSEVGDVARTIIQSRITAALIKVNSSLTWCLTLDSYLHFVQGIPHKVLRSELGEIKIRNTRIAWLDSLITEFDKPGYYNAESV